MPNIYVSKALKSLIEKRANRCCEYCRNQRAFASHSFHFEHIIPKSNGGKTVAENMAYACGGCNNHKYTKTLAIDSFSKKMVPLFNPRKQNWSEHFIWNEDHSLIIGTTPTGRATLDTLKLNREGLPNLRKVLKAAGKHPPSF